MRPMEQGEKQETSNAVMAGALPVYFTPLEVAELLRTTRTAIYSMVQRGQLPGVRRVGRRILVRRAELLRWLESQSGAA